MWFDRPRPASSLIPPPKGNILNFIDESGTPSIMNDQGDVTPSATLLGGPVPLIEQSVDPPTGSNIIAVYNKLGEGLVQRAPNNGEITELGGSAAPAINWEGGTPGSYYGAEDVVAAEHNSIIQVSLVEGAGVITINLPAITPASAGLRVAFRNVIDKKGGQVGPEGGNLLVNIDAADKVMAEGVGGGVQILPSQGFNNLLNNWSFESDGLGTWIPVEFPGAWGPQS